MSWVWLVGLKKLLTQLKAQNKLQTHQSIGLKKLLTQLKAQNKLQTHQSMKIQFKLLGWAGLS